jgi:hypothetical protein
MKNAPATTLTAMIALQALTGAALAQEQRPAGQQDAARKLDLYVQVWAQDAGVNASSVREFYAPRVVYYGKSMSREQVLRDKLNYIAAWPVRDYTIRPGSAATRCTAQGLCEARAILAWDRTSRAGKRSSGASRLTLVFSQREGGKIVRESATPLR